MSKCEPIKELNDTMPRTKDKNSVQTSIQVPVEKYEILEKIKKGTGKPISKLVVEGVDLILLEYEDILEELLKKATKEADDMQLTIKQIKSERQK